MVSEKLSDGVEKYRIIEWVSEFTNRPRLIEYELQRRGTNDPQKWETLGTSSSLGDARKALLFRLADAQCGLC